MFCRDTYRTVLQNSRTRGRKEVRVRAPAVVSNRTPNFINLALIRGGCWLFSIFIGTDYRSTPLNSSKCVFVCIFLISATVSVRCASADRCCRKVPELCVAYIWLYFLPTASSFNSEGVEARFTKIGVYSDLDAPCFVCDFGSKKSKVKSGVKT